MVERDLIVRCPGCGNGKVISETVGQSLQCDICHTTFKAPMTDDGVLEPALHGKPTVAEAPPPSPTSSGQGQTPEQSEGTAKSEQQGSGTGSHIARSQSWRSDDRETRAVVNNNAGELTAVSAPDDASDSDEELDIRATPGLFWTMLAMLAVGVIITTVVLATIMFARTFFTADSAPSVASRPQSNMSHRNAHWTDASKYSQRVAPMTLKVEQVVYGSLRAKDLSHHVIMTEDNNLLGITLSVQNRGRRPHAFQNWYGHLFKNTNGDEQMAELIDDQGRSYSLLKFDDVSYIQGQRLADVIEPRATVQDTVVFLIPKDVNRAAVKYFRLVLPGAAVGVSESFRFQVPASMIEGFVPSDRPGAEQAEPEGEFPIK